MATKTIAVLDESELKDGQMKEVDFEEGKVLVARLGDKIHATSAWCTHYGAPLAKGVLESTGRITCPWHGACFNVCTGDIEDAPALHALHAFAAEVKGGKILVTASVDQVKKGAPKRKQPKADAAKGVTGAGVVIVGGGAGCLSCVEALRQSGYTGKITVLSQEPHAPIDRTKLSKSLISDLTKLEWFPASEFREEFQVNLRAPVTVSSVSPSLKHVKLSTGEEIPYEKLVLATGSKPRSLPVEGVQLDNVFTLRHVADAAKIDAALTKGKKLVVIGSSFISMELVVAVGKRELASIDVVGMEEFPFEMVLGKEVGAGLKKYHEKNGVKFHMQSKTTKLSPASPSHSSVHSVSIAHATSGESKTLEADVVILGVGVAPLIGLVEKLDGVKSEKGGIVVNEYLEVEGLNNVYAIGDIAAYPDKRSGELKRIEHWNVANNHGRAVAANIAGKKAPFDKVPIFWSAQGQQLRYCGNGVGYDDVIIKGNPDDMKFIAYYTKAGKVIAVASMQNDPVVSKSSELIRLGLMLSVEEIKNGKSPLDVDLGTRKL